MNIDFWERFIEIMKQRLKKKLELLEYIVLDFLLNCRCLILGLGYLEVILEDNVEYIILWIVRFIEDGIVIVDGRERKVDVVFCVMGVNVDMVILFFIKGQDGIELREFWDLELKIGYGFLYIYFGFVILGFFNLLFVYGFYGIGLLGIVLYFVEV